MNIDRHPPIHPAPIGQPSIAWLLLSGLGGALSGMIVAGILGGRLGVPIQGAWLLGAGALGSLPQLYALVRGRWVWAWAEFTAVIAGIAMVIATGLALAWPSLLPLGLSVDAVHHAQLLSWMSEHAALPPASRDFQGLLGEMSVYPVGLMLVVLGVSDLVGRPALETLYPTAAILGGLTAGLVVLLAQAASAGQAQRRRRWWAPWAAWLGLLAGPALLLIHRTYLLEAYIDHSYYTMVLGVFLVLLAGAWLIVTARTSWWQFGLALAALIGTYPLWAPLPAAFAAIVLVSTICKGFFNTSQVGFFTTKARRREVLKNVPVFVSACLRGYSGLLAFGPALGLALLDLLPRLKGGQAVLVHQGLVTMPTLYSLTPLLVALPATLALLGARAGRRLAVLGGLGLALALALAAAAYAGRAANYHSYKMLFVLVPLAAALLSAAAIRLASAPSRTHGTLLVAGALAVGVTATPRLPLGQPIQLLDPDMVAAARWLRAARPQQAGNAIAINVPAGPIAYWVQIGLLGQRRDRVEAQLGPIMSARPTLESWLIDRQLPRVAIVDGMAEPFAGMQVLARFGQAAVVERAAQVDLAALHPLSIRYRAFWEHERLKTAIEMQHPFPGAVPLLDVRLYHEGRLINSYALQPEPQRTRTQYLGVDLAPQTLSAEGYINTGASPRFAGPGSLPTGALTLTLRLSVDGNSVDERQLASMVRTGDGRFEQLVPNSGELVYLRRQSDAADLQATTLDFDDALRLSGWRGPTHISASERLAIDLRWQALRRLDRSLFPEIQLVNATGETVATNLAAPQAGFYPTWRWQPGEDVTERRSFELPQGLDPGVYRLVVQVHDFGTQRLLTARQNGAPAAEIGQIVVEPALLAQH